MHRTAPSPPGPHPVCKKGGGAGEEEQDSQGLSADVCPPYVHKSSNASQASTTTVQSDFARTPNESNKGLAAITFYLIVSGLRKVSLRKFHMISLLCFQKGMSSWPSTFKGLLKHQIWSVLWKCQSLVLCTAIFFVHSQLQQILVLSDPT